MTAEASPVFRSPITEPSAWRPGDLKAGDPWDITLGSREVDDLLSALETARRDGVPLEHVDRGNFPLPNCEPVLARIRDELRQGRGFALMHGFPVEDQKREDIALMYWGFCAHLGIGVTQNSDAGLIHYVTEGRLRPNQGTRGVGNPGKVSLHVDLADCTTLLCVRQAADSPHSQLASSTAIHNALLNRAPEALDRLYEGFAWDRQNEHGETETPTTGYRVPVFSQGEGRVSCRYNRNWITKAAEWSTGLTDGESDLLDLLDEVAQENRFEFPFLPGDVQFVNNYVVLHGRAPHTPAVSEADARVLMRIWFNMDDVRPFADEAIVRHGILRHGNLGWSAADLVGGLEGRVHPRRPEDQAPLVD
ncbi:MAG: TauD/TfdA family dioxygenase [Alphaproteobacteria bacterium]|nr:TauD/TfdA family dioxygenase [Alphaproteobacteria bacterium]